MSPSKLLITGAAMVIAGPVFAADAPQPMPSASSPSTTATAPAGAAATTSPTTSSAPTTSAAAGNVAVGATVKDTQGGVVGTIESVDGQYAVLATQKNKVRLPLSSFGKGTDGPILAMTQAQVDAAASAAGATAKP